MAGHAFVAVLVIHLHFPDAASLKAKRRELAPVKHHLQARQGAAVAEIDHHDVWQRSTLLAALTSASPQHLEESADRIEAWLDARFPAGARTERLVHSLEDLRG